MNCKAKTSKGQACKMAAIKGGRGYCFNHDPGQARKRAEARKLGGQRQRVEHGAPAGELPREINTLDDARKVLNYTLLETAVMENSLQRGRLLLALIDSALKIFEIGEIEARLRALEGERGPAFDLEAWKKEWEQKRAERIARVDELED